MRHLTQVERDFIEANTIKDSGQFSWKEYHSYDGKFKVILEENMYYLYADDELVLSSEFRADMLDKYTDLMLEEHEEDLNALHQQLADHIQNNPKIEHFNTNL